MSFRPSCLITHSATSAIAVNTLCQTVLSYQVPLSEHAHEPSVIPVFLCTSIFCEWVPPPWCWWWHASLPRTQGRSGVPLTLSLTLVLSRNNTSTISLHLPDDPFGMAPNLLVCAIGTSAGLRGPRTVLQLTPHYRVTFRYWPFDSYPKTEANTIHDVC